MGLGVREGCAPPAEGGCDETSETPGPLNVLWDTIGTPIPPALGRTCSQCPPFSASLLLRWIYSPFPASFSSPALPRIHSGISSRPWLPSCGSHCPLLPWLAGQTVTWLCGCSAPAGCGRGVRVWGGHGACRGPLITAGAVPGPRDQTAQASGMSQGPPSRTAGPRGSGMGSSSLLRLLRTLCIISVLAGCLHPAAGQWFSLGSEDTTPDPGTSPVPPTPDGEEGRLGGMGTWLSQHPKFLHLSMEG